MEQILITLVAGAVGGIAGVEAMLFFPVVRKRALPKPAQVEQRIQRARNMGPHVHTWFINGKQNGKIEYRCGHCDDTKLEGEKDPVVS